MNVENLRNNHPKLISYMETAGYSNDYISRLRREIQWILAEADTRGWDCYNDVYRSFTFYYSARAIASISTMASLGKRATCTAERAGGLFGK